MLDAPTRVKSAKSRYYDPEVPGATLRVLDKRAAMLWTMGVEDKHGGFNAGCGQENLHTGETLVPFPVPANAIRFIVKG